MYQGWPTSGHDPSSVLIEELELGVRAYTIMRRMGVETCADLLRVSVHDLNAYTLATGIAVGLPAARQIGEAQEYIGRWS